MRYGKQFIGTRGNEYFCEIDEEYLTDRFNLTGLQQEVQYYQYAFDIVTDIFDFDCDEDTREVIEKSARHLYGLVHARYIITTRGLAKMVRITPGKLPKEMLMLLNHQQLEKYKKSDFGRCPRVLCGSHPLLPIGLTDVPAVKAVKLFCAKCEDVYSPKSSRHSAIDGAYFGASFPHILFQVYPQFIPVKSNERHVPRCFGFKMHATAALARWQDAERDAQRKRLLDAGVEVVEEKDDDEDSEEEESEDEIPPQGEPQRH